MRGKGEGEGEARAGADSLHHHHTNDNNNNSSSDTFFLRRTRVPYAVQYPRARPSMMYDVRTVYDDLR